MTSPISILQKPTGVTGTNESNSSAARPHTYHPPTEASPLIAATPGGAFMSSGYYNPNTSVKASSSGATDDIDGEDDLNPSSVWSQVSNSRVRGPGGTGSGPGSRRHSSYDVFGAGSQEEGFGPDGVVTKRPVVYRRSTRATLSRRFSRERKFLPSDEEDEDHHGSLDGHDEPQQPSSPISSLKKRLRGNNQTRSRRFSRGISVTSLISSEDELEEWKGLSFLGKTKKSSWLVWERNQGMLMVAAAQAFFACMNAFAKLLNSVSHIAAWELILIRMTVTWMGCYGYMKWDHTPDPILGPKEVRKLLVLRGIAGFFGLMGMYYSVQYLALSDATVLTFLGPVLSGLLAPVFLPEPFSPLSLVCGLLSVGGVLLIAKPEAIFGSSGKDVDDGVSSEERMGAIIVSLVGVVGSACAYTTIRKIGKRASALHSISYFSFFSVAASIIVALVTQSPFVFPHRPIYIILIFVIGVFGFLAQSLVTMGLQRESLSKGTMAVYSNIIWAVLLEVLIFGTLPDLLSVAGMAIIIGGSIAVALNKKPTTKGSSSVKKRTSRASLNPQAPNRETSGDAGASGFASINSGYFARKVGTNGPASSLPPGGYGTLSPGSIAQVHAEETGDDGEDEEEEGGVQSTPVMFGGAMGDGDTALEVDSDRIGEDDDNGPVRGSLDEEAGGSR